MKVLQVRFRNFRNYENLEQKINSQVNFLLGPNGSGKTNFIEALYCCLHGTSFRTSKVENLRAKDGGQDGFVEILVDQKGIQKKIRYSFSGNRRKLTVNDKSTSGLKNASDFPTVLFSPESLSIVKAGPAERRELIDQISVSLNPTKKALFQNHEKSLRARNRILKNILAFPEKKLKETAVLESLTPPYLDLCTEVTFSRLETLRELIPEYQKTVKNLFKNQALTATLDYQISGQSAIDWDLKQVYNAIVLRYEELKSREVAVGQSLIGPHKHDIQFIYENENAREFCSQGQQRTQVLALKMAHVSLLMKKRGTPPLLLLDDVFSELDEQRRNSLFEILGDIEAQIFLTNVNDMSETRFQDVLQSVYLVEEGKIQESNFTK